MKVLLTATGKIAIRNGAIRIEIGPDFCKYYKWFISKQPWTPFNLQLPKHGSHITIVNPKLHKIDIKTAQKYNGKVVEFTYDLDIIKGGSNFTNYWMKIDCPLAEQIKKELNIKESRNYLGLHITICNNKNS